MKEMILTASQVKTIDEVTLDKRTIKATFEIAMQYHANLLNELIKKEREWWGEATEIYNLDPSKQYKVCHKETPVRILEVKDEDNA